MLDMVERADVALDKVANSLPATFPQQIADAVFAGLRAQRTAFLQVAIA
jgi:hypothetical protein